MNINHRAETDSESWCHLYYEGEGEERSFAQLGARISGFRLESAVHSGTVDSSWAHLASQVGRTLLSRQWFSAWATCWDYLGSLVLREIRSELQGLGDSARLCAELRTVLINSPGWASLPHSVLRSWWDSLGEPWSRNRCQKWGKKRRLDYSAQPNLPIRHQ